MAGRWQGLPVLVRVDPHFACFPMPPPGSVGLSYAILVEKRDGSWSVEVFRPIHDPWQSGSRSPVREHPPGIPPVVEGVPVPFRPWRQARTSQEDRRVSI